MSTTGKRARGTILRGWGETQIERPDTPRRSSAKKDTKRWCGGKVGRAHVDAWVQYPWSSHNADRRDGWNGPIVRSFGFSYMLTCSACGMKWRGSCSGSARPWWSKLPGLRQYASPDDCQCGNHRTTPEQMDALHVEALQEAWARKFTCDLHGRMSYSTVRTDKTCGVDVRYDHCKRLLSRNPD